ncbi:MAG TPA: hypothetical protein VNT32_01575 [Thermoleophilaceae bacterium]|nr:hypothetical protein [Thermoleophilaceae bacterium]
MIVDPEGRYVIRPARGDDGAVEAWMVKRLAFDTKKDWERTLVSQLRDELARLPWRADCALSGVFASDDPQSCDAENLLYYNPGSAIFSALPHRLIFERLREVPPAPVPLDSTSPCGYYHAYRALPPGRRFYCWQAHELLARFDRIPVGSVTGSQAGRLVWWSLREAQDRIEVLTEDRPHAGEFGVHVVMHAAPGRGLKLAGVVKGLVDGVVGALHQGAATTAAERTAGLLWPKLRPVVPNPRVLAEALTSDRTVLFDGPAFKAHATWVQLDPADHLCAAGLVELRNDSQSGRSELSGEIFRLRPPPT